MTTKSHAFEERSAVGRPVVDLGGSRLGHVMAVGNGKFRMQPMNGEPVWLRADCVFGARHGEVALMVDSDTMGRYIVED